MAGGIGGDDGPSLWMAVAVIVCWGAFKSWASEAKKDVSDTLGIGKNTAGPFQDQTSSEIEQIEATVKSWPVTWSALPHPKSYYDSIAAKMWREMTSPVNIDEEQLIAWVKPLSKVELVAVAKCFGVKEATTFFGFTAWTGHIFQAMDVAFDGMFKKNELAQMKKIWSVTKMW